ncbi:MAG: TIGR04282 family arsenosugar biosynthesis glycosyltransferase [Anaerolineae bacterium]|nr:TIGR04282 family arsenosugar biosynthesis glycosyltransferase [Anaerolineae bacterium]
MTRPQDLHIPRRLIVYAKRPLPGYAKTRLGATLGEEAAAGVYSRLLYAYLLDLVSTALPATHLVLSVANPADVAFFAGAFPEIEVCPQVSGDLGMRMAASFAEAFWEGAEEVVLTGSDIPALESKLIMIAFERLATHDAVIGPAADGGYYLIGMRSPGADLFRNIAWSTDRVLSQTEALAQSLGLSLGRLPTLHDLDTATAYARWRAHRRPA